MRVRVIKPCVRPHADAISVQAGDRVVPDFARATGIPGWVWCAGEDGRSGWTPRAWLKRAGENWQIDRDFNAIELTLTPGEHLEVKAEESGFYWVAKSSGETGWIPCENVERLPD